MHFNGRQRRGRMSQEKCSEASDYCKSGYFKYCLQDFQGALADYTKAIDLKPGCGSAYHNRGLIFHFLGQNIEALADFTKAKELGFPVDLKNLNMLN
jgi:tetratricopeptide (TPR) repeat protein